MRLLHTTDYKLKEFGAHEIPLYAILSHVWEEDEITFQDIEGAGIKTGRDMERPKAPVP